MKKTILIFMLIIFLLFSISQISTSELKNKPDVQVDSKVYQEFQSKEKVKLMVYYNENNKENFMNYLDNSSLNVMYSAKTFNAVTIYADEQELENLKSNYMIEKIFVEPEVKLFLEQSVPLVNATNTWNAQVNTKNITGSYETICIIDTGVNYSQPDLGGCYGNNNANSNCKVLGGYAFINPVNGNSSNPMDDNGHGTHVAGIVSANGSLKGVAPDSKIISLKVCGPTSSCNWSAMVDAVNWCVNNASTFNISTISMSIGTTNTYSTYCDNEGDMDTMRDAINSAIAKNISVIIATGNSASTTEIASPACIHQNATSVADVYDANVGSVEWIGTCNDTTTSADKIVCHANRNNITDLLAPGALINSTYLSGYSEQGGTSMATPHVAGAFALLYQYNHMNSRNVTPQQIQNALNSTGKRINDTSGNNLNFSRINIYAAVLSFDVTSPNIILNSPINYYNSSSSSITFNCTASDDVNILNVTLYGNWTGSWSANETNTSLINNLPTIFNKNIAQGTYLWNCRACDNSNNCNFSVSNRTFTIDTTAPIVNLTYPENNANWTNATPINFTCNASDNMQLSNITLYGNWSGSWTANETNSTPINNTPTIFTKLLNGGTYIWNCYACDAANNCSFSSSNFTINKTYNDTIFDSSFDQGNLINATYVYGNSSGYREYTSQLNYTDDLNQIEYYWWHYYSMENAASKTIKIRITNVDEDDYDRFADIEPVYSYDNNLTWVRVPFGNYSYSNGGDFNITITPEQDKVWIAPIYPYPTWRRDELNATYYSNEYFTSEILGQTPLGKNMIIFNITDPNYDDAKKIKIYVVGQIHGGETLGSWVAQGLIKFLMNETDETARRLRKSYIFRIMPIFSEESVYYGMSRFPPSRWNGTAYENIDLNRDWNENPINYNLRREMNITYEDVESFAPDVFLDSRSAVMTENNYFYIPTAAASDPVFLNFINNISIGRTGDKDYYPNTSATLTTSGTQAAIQLYSRLGIAPSLMIEQAHDNLTNTTQHPLTHNPQNYTDYEDWGKRLGLGIYDYFGDVFPTVTLNSPSNNQQLTSSSLTFNCSATTTVGLSNITLYGNWSGWGAKENNSVTGTSNSTTFSQTISNGVYVWNCYSCDISNNCSFASSNKTFSVQVSGDGDDGDGDGAPRGGSASLITIQTNETICEENWNCTLWSECLNKSQTRTCADLNKCNATKNKPIDIQDCTLTLIKPAEEKPEVKVDKTKYLKFIISIIVVVIYIFILVKYIKYRKSYSYS